MEESPKCKKTKTRNMKNFKFILGLGIAMMNMVYGQELKSPNGNFVMDFSLYKDG